ncbi:MAG: CRISPR-associated helicase Cas3' [Proteobacteria bacterium]|nr:CRISPR-associated helicase Cas3' [Pseudomonadota bacterium]
MLPIVPQNLQGPLVHQMKRNLQAFYMIWVNMAIYSKRDFKGKNEELIIGQQVPSGANLEELFERFEADGLNLPKPDSISRSIYEGISTKSHAASMLDIRMLYSALVDADFIETEAHFQSENGRKCFREEGPFLNPERTLPCLRAYLDKLATESKASPSVNRLRDDLLKACLEKGSAPQGVFTLTAPTGTGKTLSMLSFALTHAMHHQLRRVIVVVPYLTVIEQTVREYRKALADIFGPKEIERYILEHHSLAGIRDLGREGSGDDQDMEDESRRRVRLLTENWDAPIIVTTSVQLLESLFSNRSPACRKLHRLACSVILFDEVQTLPVSVIVPTLATLSRLADHRYRTTVVLATATQPAFTHLDAHVKTYCKAGWQPKEIVPKGLNLFERAKRTKVEWPDLANPTRIADIARCLRTHVQVLCVVNLKKHALRLFKELHENGAEGLFHLSTSMCPAHRQAVLEEVRARLQRKKPCRLISTQCVEAGVDIDFPIVYRAFGPLDAIAQAAGRCNRNGSVEIAEVRVFMPEEERYPNGTYQQAASVTRMLLKRRGAHSMDIHDTELFNEYFRELYDVVRPENRKPELIEAIKRQDFVQVAQLYRVIEKDTINVLMPYDLDIFRQLEEEVRQTGLNGKWIAKARPYTIGLFRPKPREPIATYLIPVPLTRYANAEDWFIYSKSKHYHPDTGLVPPEGMECLIG